MTNGERIRAMTDDELAHFLDVWRRHYQKVMCPDDSDGCYYTCKQGVICGYEASWADENTFIKWLQTEEMPHEY